MFTKNMGVPESNKPARVFLSYSRNDLTFVERLARDLKAAGLDVWYDLSGLKGGTRWGKETQRAIQLSKYFVVVLSPDSVESEWVEREFLYAGNQGLKAIPVLCRSCDLPIWSLDVHHIDLRGAKYKENFDQLLTVLDVERAKATSDGPKLASRRALQARILLASIAVLAILLGAALIIRHPPWFCSIVPQLCLTPTHTPVATPDPNPYDGTWVGTTSQDYRLIFTVTHNVITYVFTTIHTESGDARCPTGVQTLIDTPVDYPIESNTVSGTLESSRITLRVNGTFSSDTPASGSLFFVLKGDCVSSVNVTWTATKQAVTPTSTPTPIASIDPSIQKALTEIGNAKPLYQTGFDAWREERYDPRLQNYGQFTVSGIFWNVIDKTSLGMVFFENGRLMVSSPDGAFAGIGPLIRLSNGFAVVFDAKSNANQGRCVFTAQGINSTDSFHLHLSLLDRQIELYRQNRLVTHTNSVYDFSKYNTVTVIALGDQIASFVNDQAALTAMGPGLGDMDLWLGSSASGECEFDNFKLWDLTAINP